LFTLHVARETAGFTVISPQQAFCYGLFTKVIGILTYAADISLTHSKWFTTLDLCAGSGAGIRISSARSDR
jgi:hypothetical protein